MWFKRKTDNELQAKLKALVDTIIAKEFISIDDADRYEGLLKEIYKRGLKPAAKLVPKD